MSDVNKVILVGRVGKDPEIRYTQAGEPVANFSFATGRKWTAKDGEKMERTEWHRLTVFGKVAQVVRDYVTKGKQLYIEGEIHYSEYNDKDGNKRYGTEIQVGYGGRIVLLGSKSDSAPAPAAAPGGDSEPFVATDDDVPF